MTYDDQLRTRCEGTLLDHADEIADRTGLDRSQVIRRLLRLGLKDVDDCGDQVLLGEVAGSPHEAD